MAARAPWVVPRASPTASPSRHPSFPNVVVNRVRIAAVMSVESGIEISRIENRRWRAVSSKYEYGSRLSYFIGKPINTVIPEWVKAFILTRQDSCPCLWDILPRETCPEPLNNSFLSVYALFFYLNKKFSFCIIWTYMLFRKKILFTGFLLQDKGQGNLLHRPDSPM